MKDLEKLYKEWREQIEEETAWQEEHGGSSAVFGTWDCGEGAVREDFSNFAELEEEITFEEMLKLERNYE